MKLFRFRLIFLLLFLFIVFSTVIIAQKQTEEERYVVEDFKVEDIPADDGTGLLLSWKPLERSKRIIEYRVYRGVSPDRLFFLEAIPVNVKTGVASDRMYYYDNSGSEFFDITSPSELKKEKQQGKNSPLYQKMPRNIPILAEMAGKYSLLSVSEKNNYYYRSQKVTLDKMPQSKTKSSFPEEGKTYAGLKDNQQTVLCFLNPGEKYYYSVVAVNERRLYQKPAKITYGIPVPNPPNPAAAFHTVVLEDLKELRFEWELPIFSSDIVQYRIHKISATADSLWNNIRYHPKVVDQHTVVLNQGLVGYGSMKNYCSVNIPQGSSLDEYKNAAYSLELIDADGYSSFSNLSKPRIKNSGNLPAKPIFHMEDKPNDKGDRLTVVWDHPICYVVKTTAINDKYDKFRVNYQLNQTETQKVDNIFFEFYKNGEDKPFARINEFYQDNIVILKVPNGYDYKKGFRVKIRMKGEPEIPEDYCLEQNLEYDPQMLAIMPTNALYRNGKNVSKINNIVYRKSVTSPQLTLVKRNTSYDNSLDVNIPYASIIQKPVEGFSFAQGDSLITFINGERTARKLKSGDIKTPLALLSPKVDLVYDKDNATRIETNIFPDLGKKEAEEKVKELNTTLSELKAQKAMLTDPAVVAQINQNIEQVQKQINAYSKNESLVSANKITDRKKRMRFIAKIREDYTRWTSYQVVRSDGRGLFTESDMLKDGDDILYMKPISNVFDTNKYTTLVAMLIFGIMVVVFISLAKRGKDLYIRPIAGLEEIDTAVGRATEMGRPIMYMMGHGSVSDVATIASMGILSLVARKTAEYDIKLIVPVYNYIVMPIAQEIVRDAHYSAGRPDSFDKNNVFFLTDVQFAYVAGVNGIMIRERAATNFFMGYFSAEALLMTETGNSLGSYQIAGTDAVTQIPFFITTCDYTLIGEELYAASSYLNREPMQLGTLKAQDYYKFLIFAFVVVGAVLSSFQLTGLAEIFPVK
ncbi:MAG TPA: hypothetical protein PL116_06080 [Candidatus Cloacimonas sp.]|jgi:hypothetical protein|nr:hypothetical protein [Candidatus Cloacimonas sp.]